MPSNRPLMRVAIAALALVLLCLGDVPVQPLARAAGKKDVTVTLKISDKTAGFSLEARKLVTPDTNAFDFVRHTIAVTYRTDAETGPVITHLCGISPPRGLVWVACLDGTPCKGGIAHVTFVKDAVLEWKTERPETP